jgi:hypothetical protein
MEVVYHQKGTASRINSGNARVVTSRLLVGGLTAAVSSAGVGRRVLLPATGFSKPVVAVLIPGVGTE